MSRAVDRKQARATGRRPHVTTGKRESISKTLSEIEPTPITSFLRRDWTTAVPGVIVVAIVSLLGLVFTWSYLWIFVIAAAAAGVATDVALSRLRHAMRIRDSRVPHAPLPEPPNFEVEERARVWRSLFADRAITSLVLFSFGTCVVSVTPDDHPADTAKKLLDEFGHPVAGTRSADGLVYRLPNDEFVIGGGHPNIFTFVSSDMVPTDRANPMRDHAVWLLGRTLRDLDAFALDVISVVTSRDGETTA